MVDERFEYTKLKLSEGVSQRQIARDLGIDHGTVAYWIRNAFSTGSRNPSTSSNNELIQLCNNNSPQYAYILGCYLGDGHISKLPRTYRLRIYNDVKYPEIIKDQISSLKKLFTTNKIMARKQLHANCVEVVTHNKNLARLFPQHGDGKKHSRDVTLTDWQWKIVNLEPECFIKGLIDSDGSHILHQQIIKGVIYKRYKYQFTNKSSDIISMYLKVMEMLGISAKPTTKKCGTVNVFTNKKDDVIKLDKLYEIADNKLST